MAPVPVTPPRPRDEQRRLDTAERDLAAALARLHEEELQYLLDLVGGLDPEEGDAPPVVPQSFWDSMRERYGGVVQNAIQQVVLSYIDERLDDQSIGVDWEQMNENAAQWARQYTFELIGGVVDRTRGALQEKLTAFFAAPTTVGDLRDQLAPLFGPRRAVTIASTEVTRAAAQGEVQFKDAMAAFGLAVSLMWDTNNDDRVCPICGPLDGRVQGDGWTEPPPAHPGCRCGVHTVVLKEVKASGRIHHWYRRLDRQTGLAGQVRLGQAGGGRGGDHAPGVHDALPPGAEAAPAV